MNIYDSFYLPLLPLSRSLSLSVTITIHHGPVLPSHHSPGAVHGESMPYISMQDAPRLRSLTTTVEVQEDRLALVHIPQPLYPFFLKPILQILFHEVKPLDENGNEIGEDDDDSPDLEVEEPEPSDDSTFSISTTTKKPHQPSFLNISITPVECSVMCPRTLAEKYFAPLVQQFASETLPMTITKDDFIAMQVVGEGLEAGQRVLELTSPLAMAGMYVFFLFSFDVCARANG